MHCNSISSHQFRTWANSEWSFWIHGEIPPVINIWKVFQLLLLFQPPPINIWKNFQLPVPPNPPPPPTRLLAIKEYNCSSPPAFKCQRYREDWPSNQNYSINISMQKLFNQSVQFIKSFVRYTWFKGPTIYKASSIFYHAHPIIIKVTFSLS